MNKNNRNQRRNQFEEHKHKCSFHKPSKTAFLFIPKNSSTSIRSIAGNGRQNWDRETYLYKVSYNRVCVILRDPAERFMSALNMFLGPREFTNFIGINENRLHTTDVHFQKQVDQIADIPRDKIDFFYMENGVIGKIMKYYGIKHPDLHKNKANVHKKIVTQCNEDIIRKVYEEDYKLIDSVDFVNKDALL